jgi:hypothetical protein
VRVKELKRLLEPLADDVEVVITSYYGRTEPLDEYDDYEGMPDGKYLTLWAAEVKEGRLWLG